MIFFTDITLCNFLMAIIQNIFFNFSDFSIKKWKITKPFSKELIKITEKLKNSINKLYFRTYIIFGASIIFFRCTTFRNQLLSQDLRETKKENGWMICQTLICFWKELEKDTKPLSLLRFFLIAKVISNTFFFGKM